MRTVDDARFEALVELLQQAFPDRRCVRCGGEDFYMRAFRDDDLSVVFDDTEVMETVCQRCGFDERHVVAMLEKAEKPITPGGGDGG